MRPLTPLLAFGLALGLAGPAPAQTLKVGYGITLSGIPLGTADLATSFEGQRYRMELAAKLTGLAGLLTSGRGAATASGAARAVLLRADLARLGGPAHRPDGVGERAGRGP